MFPVNYIYHVISPDAIIPNAANPQSFNRYADALGNPLRFVDPSGHCGADPYFDGDCWELQSWINEQLENGSKYFVFDGFSLGHKDIQRQTGTLQRRDL